ncbi:MAG: response regulator [Gammaproteobacteria bacterium]|nr:response regulator [Gammaproteobacteria bacterium]
MNEAASTVFIIDDDEAIRGGLSMLLAGYGYLVECFCSADAFLGRCDQPLPESCMAILDLSMPGMNGLELQEEMNRRHIRVPTVFLSGEGDIPAAVNAVRHGAVDFVEKPVDTDLLVDRIEAALRQQLEESENDVGVHETRSCLDTLTEREREVLENLAGGKISKVIAHDLGISERTVELHRSRILKKMGARNTTELLNQVIPVLLPKRFIGK